MSASPGLGYQFILFVGQSQESNPLDGSFCEIEALGCHSVPVQDIALN